MIYISNDVYGLTLRGAPYDQAERLGLPQDKVTLRGVQYVIEAGVGVSLTLARKHHTVLFLFKL